MTILYEVYNGLYVNITNKCDANCVFCLRNGHEGVYGSNPLWLEREPSVEEVEKEFEKFDMDKYEEVVFCGFGEPTERLADMAEIGRFVKEKYGKKIRVNTNGLSDLLHKRDTAPDFAGWADSVSISLNTPNKEKYYELTKNIFGIDGFDGMLNFAKNVKKYVPDVKMTTVDTTITKEEEAQCRKICDDLGVRYRIRAFED